MYMSHAGFLRCLLQTRVHITAATWTTADTKLSSSSFYSQMFTMVQALPYRPVTCLRWTQFFFWFVFYTPCLSTFQEVLFENLWRKVTGAWYPKYPPLSWYSSITLDLEGLDSQFSLSILHEIDISDTPDQSTLCFDIILYEKANMAVRARTWNVGVSLLMGMGIPIK